MSDTYGVPVPEGTFTDITFGMLAHPPCPVCGAPIDFQQIDITTQDHFWRTQERQYIAGPPECAHGCNLMTGERMHYEQSVSRPGFQDGYDFRCSCGVAERNISGDRLAELLAEHKRSPNASGA